MQNRGSFLIVFSFILFSCNSPQKQDSKSNSQPDNAGATRDTMDIFPVTDYISGQIKLLKSAPLTPLRTLENGGKTDSIWIAREDIRRYAEPFLKPVIDSAFLEKYFSGSSFFDQTVNAITFNYVLSSEQSGKTPLKSITVYVHPQTNKVERVYLEKEKGDTVQQLTWKSDNWFSIRTIEGGKIEEEKVKWNFDD